jgi:hypothetical protein
MALRHIMPHKPKKTFQGKRMKDFQKHIDANKTSQRKVRSMLMPL